MQTCVVTLYFLKIHRGESKESHKNLNGYRLLGLSAWEPTGCTSGPHKRSNGTFRLLFVLFLFIQEKDRVSPLPKEERNVLFSMRRKGQKDSLRLPPQTPIVQMGSIYPRLPTDGTAHLRALSVIRRAESYAQLELLRPQAQARCAPYERPPARCSGKGRRGYPAIS